MAQYQPGDLITLRLADDRYLLAKLIHIENLALNDNYHLAVYDTILAGGPPGSDYYDEWHERTHEYPSLEKLPVTVDHLGLTYDAFLDSDPVVLGNEEVSRDELRGFRVHMELMRQEAIRKGILRDPDAEEPSEDDAEYQLVGEDEEYEGDEYSEEEEIIDEESEEEADMEEDQEEEELVEVTVHTWHSRIFDVPVAYVFRELSEIFEQPELKATTLGEYVTGDMTSADTEVIEELVEQLCEGDYGAGQELLDYGDPAAAILARKLQEDPEPQVAEDILQILGDMGSNHAYKGIADFFAAHASDLNTPLGLAAVRAYCYAVMLTGGTPEPLRSHLNKLAELDHPELTEDIQNAVAALEEMPDHEPDTQQQTSADPFSSLGG